MKFDDKPRYIIELQHSVNDSFLVHIWRFYRVNEEIDKTTEKTYHVTKASYQRVAHLVNKMVNSELGNVIPWWNSPGSWTYTDYGTPLESEE